MARRSRETSEGRGNLTAIRGEAGIGKTYFLQRLAAELTQSGLAVMRGQCTDRSGRAPFLPLVEAVSQFLSGTKHTRIQELWRVRLDRYPEMGFLFGGKPGPADPTLWTTHLYIQLAEALGDLGKQHGGMVLLLDDFHQVDDSSLGFLQFLTTRIGNLHMAIVLTLSPEELVGRDDLRAFLHEASGEGMLQIIDLRPLDLRDAMEVARNVPGHRVERSEVARLNEEARGNPLFLEELLKQGTTTATRAMSRSRIGDLILARYYSLEPGLRELVKRVAVAGEGVTLATVEGSMAVPRQEISRLVTLAIELGLLEETTTQRGLGLRFRHGQVREAILVGVTSVEQASLRHLLGQALERNLGGREATHELYDLAHYFKDSPDLRRAADYLYRARTRAADSHATAMALRHFRTLAARPELMAELSIEQRFQVRFHLAQILYRLGDVDSAIYELEAIEDFPDRASKVRAYAWRGNFLMWGLRFEDGLRIGRQAVSMGRGTKEGVHAQVLLLRNLISASRFAEAKALARRLARSWNRYNWDYTDRLTYATCQVDVAHLSFDLRKVVSKQEAMLRLAVAARDPIRELTSYVVLMIIWGELDRPRKALAYAEKILKMARVWQVLDDELEATVESTAVRARLGHPIDEALSTISTVLNKAVESEIDDLVGPTIRRLLELLPLAGRRGEVSEYLRILDQTLGRKGKRAKASLYHYLHGLGLQVLDRHEEALVHFRRSSRAGLDIGDGPMPVEIELALAESYVALGERAKARLHARRGAAWAVGQSPIRGRARAHMVLGQLEASAGRTNSASEEFLKASRMLRRAGYRALANAADLKMAQVVRSGTRDFKRA